MQEIRPRVAGYSGQTEHAECDNEPIGIVISRGRDAELAPRVAAYVWGQLPDDELDAEEAKAA